MTALRPIVLAWLKTGCALDAEPPRALDHRRGRIGRLARDLRHLDPPVADGDDVRERAADVDAEHQPASRDPQPERLVGAEQRAGLTRRPTRGSAWHLRTSHQPPSRRARGTSASVGSRRTRGRCPRRACARREERVGRVGGRCATDVLVGSLSVAPPLGRAGFIAAAPPSTGTMPPAMNDASSLSRNATSAATSSGVPGAPDGRVSGALHASPLPPWSAPSGGASRFVGTMPGATALTRTPRGPPYTAAAAPGRHRRLGHVVRHEVRAAPVAGDRRGQHDRAAAPLLPNCRNAARSPRNTPRTLTFMTASNSSISMSGYGASVPPMPAFRW